MPADLRSLIAEHAAAWDVPDIWVGCSGNFTIERILARHPARLHGNDVQLYSCAIGSWLAGHPLTIGIADEHREEWGWLEPWIETPIGAVATIMLATRMLQGWGHTNAYYERVRAGYRAQWPDLHAKTVARIDPTTLHLASFDAGDVMAFLERCPPEAAFACFPPFDGGGYESMFRGLEELFTWDRPTYPEFDPERDVARMFARAEHQRHWLIATSDPMVGREAQLRGRLQIGRGRPVHVYASGDPRRVIRSRTAIEPVPIPRLRQGDALTGRLRLVELTAAQFAALRSQYLAPGIIPSAPQLPLGVMVGERLVGAFGLTLHAPVMTMSDASNSAYLLSDFPVAPTDEPRLSNLVLMAALSVETRRLAERQAGHRIREVATTAFTARPVSMKYRGAGFRLISRKPHTDAFGNAQWALNYASGAGLWTLEEGYQQWSSRHHGSASGASDSGSAISSSSRSTRGSCGPRRSGRSSPTSATTAS